MEDGCDYLSFSWRAKRQWSSTFCWWIWCLNSFEKKEWGRSNCVHLPMRLEDIGNIGLMRKYFLEISSSEELSLAPLTSSLLDLGGQYLSHYVVIVTYQWSTLLQYFMKDCTWLDITFNGSLVGRGDREMKRKELKASLFHLVRNDGEYKPEAQLALKSPLLQSFNSLCSTSAAQWTSQKAEIWNFHLLCFRGN